MTGPEHYREAERLLVEAATEGAEGTYFVRPESLAAAQVHATLALAAATALSDPTRSGPRATVPEWDAWQHTAGVPDQASDYDIRESLA